MRIPFDGRHSKQGNVLFCKVSFKDLKGFDITVSKHALLSDLDSLQRVVFEFEPAALSWIEKELHLTPAGQVAFNLDESAIDSLRVYQTFGGSSFFLIPIPQIAGFVECDAQPLERAKDKRQLDLFPREDSE